MGAQQLLFFKVMALFCAFSQRVEAQPNWKNQQAFWQSAAMSANRQLAVCRLGDVQNIFADFSVIVQPRVVGSPQHTQVASYMKRQLDNLAYTTEYDTFYDNTPYGQKRFRNLIATFDPTAPRRLVLACHYDSKIINGYNFAGATDSAMPCSILIDIARTLKPAMDKQRNGNNPSPVTLQLVFFDGEEAFRDWTDTDSLYGSRHLANKWANQWYPMTENSRFHLSKELERIDVLVLLDLLGAANPKIANAQGLNGDTWYKTLPEIERTLRQGGCLKMRATDTNIFSDNFRWGQIQDDHIPFMQKGVRIIHAIPSPFPSVWHQVSDNYDAMHQDTVHNLAAIFRVFVARYMHLPV